MKDTSKHKDTGWHLWGNCLSENLFRVTVVRDCPFTPQCTRPSIMLRRRQFVF